MSDSVEINRAFWDEVAPHHAASDHYALDQFVRTRDTLGDIEKAELGRVAGLEICHLQCHIGLDTLSLAELGAHVTGVDFSAEALRIAQELSARTGIAAEFVRSDVLTAAANLQRAYDLIFTTRGVLMWVGDLDRWAANCFQLLRPGGVFYLLDLHPLGMVLEPADDAFRLTASYFGDAEPSVTAEDASYAVRDVGLTNQTTHEWVHPVGAVVTALINVGLIIEFLHEHATDAFAPTTLSQAPAHSRAQLPALYSIRAVRPE